jgi:hypothetical protein
VSQNDAYETEGPVLFGGNHRSSNYPNQLHSTYDSSSSGYHAQGQVSNSLNIDPALLAMGQGVRPQPPIHQFNMHPGSQVTFAGNAFQQSFGGNAFQQSLITQGNQNMRVEGTEPPANDADQANEDAQMFDASFSDNDTSLSKYEPAPAMPAPGLDSLHSKPDHSHDLMLPPPLPLKDLAHNTGNNDYIIFTQLNGVHSAASPDVFSPKFMNSGDGYTVGGASAMEESREYSSSNVSPTRKRASSSSDDSSSNVSIGNAGERFHNLQHPMSSSKRARITKPSPSFSSSESQVSISMSRRESLLAADYSGVKVASRPRKGMSPKEAAERCFKRVRLSISGDDNVDEVKAEREMWLDSIMQAFDAPYNQTPKTKNIDLQGFQHWQKEHHALTMEQFEEDPADDLAEAIATHLYNQVVDGHEKGSLVESCGKSFRYDTKLNCKDRLEKIIKALTGLTIIRFDIVTGARVNELVANPDAVFKRKEENKLENDRKRVRTEAAKAADKKKASALTAKNGKAQVNDKRGGQTKSAAVEDDHESSSGSDDASGSEKLRSSTRISTSVPEPRPVEPFNDDESSSRPDHEKLASAPEALASSARGVSTSISVSNPVKQVYSDESSSGSDW